MRKRIPHGFARSAGLCLLASLAACAAADRPGPASTVAATYTNPVLYADYSDPDVIQVGEDYYMVASSFHFSPGIPILKSRDLVHWTIVGHVLPRLPFGPLYDMPGPHTLDDTISKPIGGTKYASGVWAPSIRFHDGKFWVYWATPDEGVFMATATDPSGEWSPVTRVIAGPGYEDPCPFWDADGTAWLIHGKVGAGPLVLHRMTPDGTRVLDDGVVVAEDRERLPILEGPKFIKRGDYYYVFAPIGGVGTGSQAVGRARDIRGPYEWRDVLRPTPVVRGPHQGGYVETANGDGWFLHFNSTGAFGRIVWLEPVIWRDDWPVMGDPAAGEDFGYPVLSHTAPEVADPSPDFALQSSDAFSGAELGLQWSWNHNPDPAAWSLTERPGYLRLRADAAEHLVTSRNTLTQILQGPSMTGTARIDVSHMVDGQRAGLALFGVRPSWIGAVREDGATRVTLAIEGSERAGPAITESTIDLRFTVSSDQAVRYAYSIDGGANFVAVDDAVPLAHFSWWKGSRPALFTFTRGAAIGGYVDVDWFQGEVTTP